MFASSRSCSLQNLFSGYIRCETRPGRTFYLCLEIRFGVNEHRYLLLLPLGWHAWLVPKKLCNVLANLLRMRLLAGIQRSGSGRCGAWAGGLILRHVSPPCTLPSMFSDLWPILNFPASTKMGKDFVQTLLWALVCTCFCSSCCL